MSDYHVLYDSWKKYTISDNPINEIDRLGAKKILDWVSSSMPDNYSFDNIFGNKMRIIIPLEFDEKNIVHGKLSNAFSRLLDLIDQHSRWQYDNESLSRGSVYKINTPKDFGPEKNLERYKNETPPPAKRVEQKIGKLLKAMNKFKNKDDDLPIASLKKINKIWEEEGDKSFCPQGSIIISRHPVDVARMSDFKNIQSCHTPGSDFYKCAFGEAMGQGPVAYFVSKKQLDKFFDDKGITDIDELGREEVLQDGDRDIKGISPTARVRLRKFTGENEDGRGFELMVPEIRAYGNEIAHFQETVNNWALNSQLQDISSDRADQYLLRNKSWREDYIQAFLQVQFHGEDNNQASESAIDTMNDIRDRLEGLFPDRIAELQYHGGRYMDGEAQDLFMNFFGVKEFRDVFAGQATKRHPANIYSRDFIDFITEEYGDTFFTESTSEEEKVLKLEDIILSGVAKRLQSFGIYGTPVVSFEEEQRLGTDITPSEFFKGLVEGNKEYADLCEMSTEDVIEGMFDYISMISYLKKLGSQFSKFTFELVDIEDMLGEQDNNFTVEDIIKQCKSGNWRFRMRIKGIAGGPLIEKIKFRDLSAKDSEYAKDVAAIIEKVSGESDMLEKAQGRSSAYGHYGGFADLNHELKHGIQFRLNRGQREPAIYGFTQFAVELLTEFYFKTGTEDKISRNDQGELFYTLPDMFNRESDQVQKEAERILEACIKLEKKWPDVESSVQKILVDKGIVDIQAPQKIVKRKTKIMAEQAQEFIKKIDEMRSKMSELYNSLSLDIREDFSGLFNKDSGEWANPNVNLKEIENLMSGLSGPLYSATLNAVYEVSWEYDPTEDQDAGKLLNSRANKDNLCAMVTQNIRKFLENKSGRRAPVGRDQWWNVTPKDVIVKSIKAESGQYKFSFHFPISITNVPDVRDPLNTGIVLATLYAYLEVDESTEDIKNIIKETLYTGGWASESGNENTLSEKMNRCAGLKQLSKGKRKRSIKIKIIKS